MSSNTREKHLGNVFNKKNHQFLLSNLKKYIKKPNKWQSYSEQYPTDSATEINLRTL